MTIEKLKQILENTKAKSEAHKERNAYINRTLSGDGIATEQGKINDAYYKGRLEIINYVLNKLNELESENGNDGKQEN